MSLDFSHFFIFAEIKNLNILQILKSQINPNSKEFQDNKKAYLELMARYREGMAMSMQGGGAVAVEKHKKRHKLLARERIDQLIDKNTPFLELSPMAAYDTYNNVLDISVTSAQ